MHNFEYMIHVVIDNVYEFFPPDSRSSSNNPQPKYRNPLQPTKLGRASIYIIRMIRERKIQRGERDGLPIGLLILLSGNIGVEIRTGTCARIRMHG